MPNSNENSYGNEPSRRRLAGRLTGGIACWSGYLVLSGSVTTQQIATGALVALGILALHVRICRTAGVDLHLQAYWVARALVAFLRQLMPDTWRVTRRLFEHLFGLRPLCGQFRRIAFDAGGDNPLDTGRRALVMATISWTPNAYAVCHRPEVGELLIHELELTAVSKDPRWPI
jgi:multisubunit Na+/H+ antiporter MnhE subunit